MGFLMNRYKALQFCSGKSAPVNDVSLIWHDIIPSDFQSNPMMVKGFGCEAYASKDRGCRDADP